MAGQVERIVIIPRNGLGNRLQAWASASVLAHTWNAPLDLVWETENSAPAPFPALFRDLPHFKDVSQALLDRSSLDRFLGSPHESLPRYLWHDTARRIIVLAGHDRGEQVFMSDLVNVVASVQEPQTLVIIAGGHFDIGTQIHHRVSAFAELRREFYRSLSWNSAVTDAAEASTPTERFSALHIRLTDRSLEAPTRRATTSALAAMRTAVAQDSLFIAADTPEARREWSRRARAHGYEPWSVLETDFSRESSSGGVSAAVDWLLLSRAHAIVYPAASTFSSEAVVASKARSWPLMAGSSIQGVRRMRRHIHDAVTFPVRRMR